MNTKLIIGEERGNKGREAARRGGRPTQYSEWQFVPLVVLAAAVVGAVEELECRWARVQPLCKAGEEDSSHGTQRAQCPCVLELPSLSRFISSQSHLIPSLPGHSPPLTQNPTHYPRHCRHRRHYHGHARFQEHTEDTCVCRGRADPGVTLLLPFYLANTVMRSCVQKKSGVVHGASEAERSGGV